MSDRLIALFLVFACLSGSPGCDRPAPPPALPTRTRPPWQSPPGLQVPPVVIPEPGARNLLVNPGFESGDTGWGYLQASAWRGMSVDPGQAHSGQSCGRMVLESVAGAGEQEIFGFLQEIAPQELPARLGGWYRIDEWRQGTPHQYLQAVVQVWGDPAYTIAPNYQLRYILAGTDEAPFPIGNGRFVFVGPKEPVMHKWVRFEADVRGEFQKYLGRVPTAFSKLRIFFEARYDGKDSRSGHTLIDVAWDDLFLGAGE